MGQLIPDRAQGTSHSELVHALLKSTKQKAWDGSVIGMFVRIRKISPSVKIGRLPGDEGGDMYI